MVCCNRSSLNLEKHQPNVDNPSNPQLPPRLVFALADRVVDAVPAKDSAIFIAERFKARIDPAILAILPTQPTFVLKWLSTGKRCLEHGLDGRLVVGMEQLHMRSELPRSSRFLLGRVDARPVDEPFVEIVRQSRWRHQPDHSGNGIDQQPEFPLALA